MHLNSKIKKTIKNLKNTLDLIMVQITRPPQESEVGNWHIQPKKEIQLLSGLNELNGPIKLSRIIQYCRDYPCVVINQKLNYFHLIYLIKHQRHCL